MKYALIAGTLLLAFGEPCYAAASTRPSGDIGIASRYVGDVNIENDPALLFFDGFDSYTSNSQLINSGNWTNLFQYSNILLDTPQYIGGTKSLRLRMLSNNFEVSNAIVKQVNHSQDTLFLRAYTKFSLRLRWNEYSS